MTTERAEMPRKWSCVFLIYAPPADRNVFKNSGGLPYVQYPLSPKPVVCVVYTFKSCIYPALTDDSFYVILHMSGGFCRPAYSEITARIGQISKQL